MAEQAVNVIYKMAENPDLICEEMLKEITKIVMTHYIENGSNDKQLSDPANNKENNSEKKDGEGEEEGEKEAAENNQESSQPEPSQSQGK